MNEVLESIKSEKLEKIRKWLPWGYARIIQKETGKSRAYIYQVAVGRYENEEVMDALLRLAIKTKGEVEKEAEKQKELLSQL